MNENECPKLIANDITKYLDSDSEESVQPLKNEVKISEEASS